MDRLHHHFHIIKISGHSYRIKDKLSKEDSKINTDLLS
ncbi:hypothetical protein [Abyssisolibacter fermentans]